MYQSNISNITDYFDEENYGNYSDGYNDSEIPPFPTTGHTSKPSMATERQNFAQILTVVFYCVICLLGILGNSLVIGITGFKIQKSVNTIWLLNLAIADFLFTFFLPLTIAYAAMNFHWVFGVAMCKLNSFVMFLNMFASVLLLTTISLDRCISVIFPVWSQNHRKPRTAYAACAGVWAASFLLSLPSLLYRDIISHRGRTICFNNYSSSAADLGQETHTAVVLSRFICGFIVPVIIITSSYITIVLKLRRNRMIRSRRPFRIISAIIVAFFICWTPYHVLHIMEIRHSSISQSVLKIGLPLATALATANSCMNPILYVFMGQDFRKFKINILSRLEHALSEETVQSRISLRSASKMSSVNEKETPLI